MNIEEPKGKFISCCFTIGCAIVCAPSNLFFMAFFSPSRYESKLWDLKLYLQREAWDTNHVSAELKDFETVYRENSSRWFEAFLVSLNNKTVDRKYIYYTRSAIDWELLRVQPMRYIWNETDQLPLYCLIFPVFIGINSFLKQMGRTNLTESFAKHNTVNTMMRVESTVSEMHSGWKHKWSWYRGMPSRIKFPIVLINGGNFMYLLGGYKKNYKCIESKK